MPIHRGKSQLPTFDKFMRPLVQALKGLGGSGSIGEINSKVFEGMKLDDAILQIPHGEGQARTEIEYRMAWTRTYLKRVGILLNSERGVWSLMDPSIDPQSLDPAQIIRSFREKSPSITKSVKKHTNVKSEDDQIWKEALVRSILKLSPAGFERLAQRLLRESGFTQVEVTGKSGDGGIDGKGIVRISGVLSFHVIFQCKRYKRPVPPKEIRDFRGAMQGRSDKGLFVTTSSFTRDAIKEATRDGAPPIDLIDGDTLCDKLKELRLGVKVTQVEQIEIDTEWLTRV